MTRLKTFKVIVISLILILAFDYIIYKCYFDQNVLALLGIFVVLFSSFALGVAIPRLWINENFSWTAMTSKERYTELKQKIGNRIHIVTISFFAVSVLTIWISAKSIFNAAEMYKSEQLEKYGEFQKVVIDRTGYLKGYYIRFNFKHAGRIYENHFSTDKNYDGYLVGDTINIKFSTADPNIVDGPFSN